MTKIRVQAQHLRHGDIVTSGERVESIWEDIRTPSGKINIQLSKPLRDQNGQVYGRSIRQNQWRKHTMVSAERP